MNLDQGGQGESHHDLDRRAGAGRESRILEKVALKRRGQELLPERSVRPGADPAADVEEHTGVTAVEKAIQVKVVKQAEILEGVGMDSGAAVEGLCALPVAARLRIRS
jgi:hypothetical protein